MTPEEQTKIFEESSVVLDGPQCEKLIEDLAAQINQDYGGKNPIFVVIMRGGLFFGAEIMRRFRHPMQLEYVDASRYHNKTYGSDLVWNKGIDFDIKGRHIVLLDDIFDEGITISIVKKLMIEKGAASCKDCVLLVKKRRDTKEDLALPDYYGALVPDKYLFGRGMDVRAAWRQLDEVRALKEE